MLNWSEWLLHNDRSIVAHFEGRDRGWPLSTVPHEQEPIFDMKARSLITSAIRGIGFLECNTVGSDAQAVHDHFLDRIAEIGEEDEEVALMRNDDLRWAVAEAWGKIETAEVSRRYRYLDERP